MGLYARSFNQLSRMLSSGHSLMSALDQIQQSRPKLRDQFKNVIKAIDRGHTLVDGFAIAKARFPSFVWGHLEAGERSGHLVTLLAELADELSARRKWVLGQIFNFRTLWLMAVFAFGAISLAVTESVRHLTPEIVDRGEVAVLTAIGSGALSRSIVYGSLITGAVLLFAWYQIKGKHRFTQRWPWLENLRLRTPLFGQIAKLESWRRYLNLLARMIESGLPLHPALKLAQADIEYPRWQSEFSILQTTLDRGGTLAEGFQAIPHVPQDLPIEVDVGEKTGSLAECLRRDATQISEQIQRLRQLVTVVFLVASLVLGILITIMVFVRGLGAWIPIYEKVLYS